jgi:hypothetical protein
MLCLFLSYWYNRGWAKLRTGKALPDSIPPITLPSSEIAPSHLRVTLPDGTSAPIPTLHNEHASLMFGIYFGPTFGGSTHMRKIAKKGYTWADRIRSQPLSSNLAWKSFTHQLQPGMMWGIATLVMSPHRLLKQFQQVYFRCLPLLNVNCHIELPWRLTQSNIKG